MLTNFIKEVTHGIEHHQKSWFTELYIEFMSRSIHSKSNWSVTLVCIV